MLLKWIRGNEKKIKRSSVVWNAIGGGLNAVQSAIVLIFISHKLGLNMAGIITIAFALGTFFLSIGKYGIRNFQVTDVDEYYSFTDYLYSRIAIIIFTIVLSILYMLYYYFVNKQPIDKTLVIFIVIILKLVDAMEDVFIGRYQQKGRLDIGAKILAFRMIVATVLICGLVAFSVNIYIVLIITLVLSVAIDVYFIYMSRDLADMSVKKADIKKVVSVLVKCFPLCVGTTLAIYIGNVPKYMIDRYMNEETQAIFGYIMMPVFCIMLLSTFIYMPMVKSLGELWADGKVSEFCKNVFRQCIIIVSITVLAVVGGIIVGLPVLTIMYGVDLSGYKLEFMLLLLGGGFYALAYYLNVPLTTIRWQNYIAIGYIIVAVLALIGGGFFVKNLGMLGASLLYLTINFLLFIIYLIMFVVGVKKAEKSAV